LEAIVNSEKPKNSQKFAVEIDPDKVRPILGRTIGTRVEYRSWREFKTDNISSDREEPRGPPSTGKRDLAIAGWKKIGNYPHLEGNDCRGKVSRL